VTTLKEIAARCGCSVATVSKALNAMPDISPETAKRIRQIANEMGYIPNAAARTLKTNRSHTIALLLFLRNESVWKHDYFARVACGIQSVTESAGYDITPVTCTGDAIRGRYVDYCRHRGYDGVIVMSGQYDEAELMELVNSEIPLVTIDYAFHHRGAVISDNAAGMSDLVRFVHSRGHERIAYIYGEDGTVSQTRLAAFYDTCQQLGVHVPDEYVKSALYRDHESSAKATRELLALPKPPTCILYPDDYASVGGMHEIVSEGMRIPHDVSIAGFDGIPLSGLLRPRLTTLAQDAEGVGQNAGRLILKAIESPKCFLPQHIMLKGRVIEGETVSNLTAL